MNRFIAELPDGYLMVEKSTTTEHWFFKAWTENRYRFDRARTSLGAKRLALAEYRSLTRQYTTKIKPQWKPYEGQDK